MVRDVRVHLLPALFEPEELRGGIAVVIDVLRASTTIVHALAHGAKCVIPCLTVDDAQKTARGLAPNEILLGGEREGFLIPGFDLDNNPFAYTAEVVTDKAIVFTTTNGTAALHRAALADRVLIGGLVNLKAIVRQLFDDTNRRDIHLVCAGTCGKITLEDAICAGAICSRLSALESTDKIFDWTDDQQYLVQGYYGRCFIVQDGEFTWPGYKAAAEYVSLREGLRHGYGGRNCLQLGFDEQINRAATLDLFDIVPEYEHSTGRIVRG